MKIDQWALCLAKSKHRAAQSWRSFARDPEQVGNKMAATIIADAHASAARDLLHVARMIRIEGKP